MSISSLLAGGVPGMCRDNEDSASAGRPQGVLDSLTPLSDPFSDPFSDPCGDLFSKPFDGDEDVYIPSASPPLSSAPSSVPPSPTISQRPLSHVDVAAPGSDGLLCDDSLFSPPAKQKTTYGVVGISSSAQASRKLKEAMENNTLTIHDKRLQNYKDTCLVYDRYAQFRYGAQWKVWHSICGRWYAQKEAYHTTRFTEHATRCLDKCRAPETSQRKRKHDNDDHLPRRDVKIFRHGSLDGWVKRSKDSTVQIMTDDGMVEKFTCLKNVHVLTVRILIP